MPVEIRPARLVALSITLLAAMAATPALNAAKLIPNTVARQHGLVRAWFSQARVNPARYKIENVVLQGDRLFVLTTSGNIQAFNAETGKLVWQARIGNPDHPSLGPVADDQHVAIVNGGSVYVLERASGQEVLLQRVNSGIAAAPALSEHYVFIPQFNGRVDAFGLENPRPIPWYFTSAGRIFQDAVASPASIVWATDAGHLYVADPDAHGVRFRLESATPIVAPATTHSDMIFAASTGGYVYAMRESTGAQVWRYAAGAPVEKSPIALGKTVYVATEEPALHCIDAESGEVKWIAPSVAQFVAASPTHVYGLDRLGNFLGLDREHGVVKTRARSMGDYQAVLNEINDRLYLFTPDGLLQCFHEIGREEPAMHDPKKEAAIKEEAETLPETVEEEPTPPIKEEKEETAPDPFGGGVDPFGGGADPFGGEADPFGGGADPFGGGDSSDADPFQ